MSLRTSPAVSDTVRIKIDYIWLYFLVLGEQVYNQIIRSEKNEVLWQIGYYLELSLAKF